MSVTKCAAPEGAPLGLDCIDVAVDHNILVYDDDAKQGEFTTRLLKLLKNTMNENREQLGTSLSRKEINIAHLYFSAKPDIDWTPQDCTVTYQPNILDRFNELGGSLKLVDDTYTYPSIEFPHTHQDQNLVAAIGDGGEILLGSY